MNNTNTVSDEYDYRKFMVDDDDDISDSGSNDVDYIDTSWITEYETKMMNDDYQLFLKSDITHVSFEFYYLDRDKMYVERIVPMTYSLRDINKITQNEIFSIIQSRQWVDKKYYNFQSLLLYSFDFQDNCKDIVRSLSNYIRGDSSGTSGSSNEKSFIEYTNLLSIDVIYFPPLITMFHEFLGFSVLLYED
jgi:hypothetical protein